MSDEATFARAIIFANVYTGCVFRMSPAELRAGNAYQVAVKHAASAADYYERTFHPEEHSKTAPKPATNGQAPAEVSGGLDMTESDRKALEQFRRDAAAQGASVVVE